MSTHGPATHRLTRRQLKSSYFPHDSLGYHLHALPKHRVIYVKNPKAACSTVLLWLSRIHSGDLGFSPDNVHTTHGLPSPGDIGWPKVMRLLEGAGYRFTFVRDPLQRFESAYRDKIANPTPFRAKIQETLGLPVDTDSAAPTFEQFLNAVEQQDPVMQMDPHWRPQHVNLMHPMVSYDLIGRVETFDADLARLREAAGLPEAPVEIRNVANRQETSEYDDRPDLVQRVRALYAQDYDLYGY